MAKSYIRVLLVLSKATLPQATLPPSTQAEVAHERGFVP
jgi:hypothetical protein